jgi:hypothetical protein
MLKSSQKVGKKTLKKKALKVKIKDGGYQMKRLCKNTGPQVQILQSDNQSFHAKFSFGQPQLQDLFDAGEAGQPAVPVLRRLVAVPQRAEPYLAFARPVLGEQLYVNLYPFQPLREEFSTRVDQFPDVPPPPELFALQPFMKDEEAYSSSRRFPGSPCSIRSLGTARDLQIAMLECACGQYNPSTRILQLFDSVDVQIGFKGGTGMFLTDRALNPFESGLGIYTGVVLNQEIIKNYLEHDSGFRQYTGEELLILTHSNYRTAAEKLAKWRRECGIPTSVFNVDDGTGPLLNTKEEIRAFIHQRYNSCVVRPSYILLFGDVADVPTWVMLRLIYTDGSKIATDFPYATLASDPEALVLFPDFAVGRIPVNDVGQAQAVVDKIIKYEFEPPPFSAAYHRATVASYFQCCRTDVALPGVENGRRFILNAEFLRDSLMEIGYDVQRIYNTSTAYPETPPYLGDTTPRYFGDSTALPEELNPDNGFSWSGGTQDIISAINEGRAFVFHIDHGYTGGWVDPALSQSNVASLSNTFPPVVFDMDCSSGNFEATCFAEIVLKPATAGAIGVFGWTRMSNTAYYRSLLEGILYALWPGSFPQFGNDSVNHRLGDVLNYSKIYMAQQKAGTNPQTDDYKNAVNHVRLYHLMGDPMLEPWTLHPFQLTKEIEVTLLPDFNLIEIHYSEEEAIITVQQQMVDGSIQPISRGVIKNGVAQLNIVLPLGTGPLLLSASKSNALTAILPSVQIDAAGQ